MDIFKEFGLYDILGRLIPGILIVWAVLAVIETKGAKKLWYRLRKQILFLLVMSYLVGSIAHAISSLADRPLKQSTTEKVLEDYPDQFRKQLIARAETAFELSFDPVAESEEDNRKQLIDLCHTFCQAHNADDYVEIMQARFAFHRTLIVAMFVAAIAFGYRFISQWAGKSGRLEVCSSLCILLAFILGLVVSVWRTREFSHHFADHTFRMFYLRYDDSATVDDRSEDIPKATPDAT